MAENRIQKKIENMILNILIGFNLFFLFGHWLLKHDFVHSQHILNFFFFLNEKQKLN